ncbi:PilZ domain-containing protein [Sphingomonas guangdongensis]|uniref:PilZ domain-containing protein n=2 Tax=Sphingomonas guangdongensis TaxID=1141890 RepID=A0A285QA60_9SPHN|nr:PilZ domain-containing protein [Sphingomonas guangdongensis]
MQLDGTHHQRRSPRLKLFLPGEMIVRGASSRVHLLNLSTGGALVHAPTPVSPGSSVIIHFAREARAARVAWVDGQRAGLCFTTPLSDEGVRQVVAA